MSACFRLIHTQKIDVDKNKTLVTLSTKSITGHVHYFHLSRNQFFAFDDAIALIDSNCSFNNYPLGNNIWLYHYGRHCTLYTNTASGQPYFKFTNFHLYKTRIHQRVMSFLRSSSEPDVTSRRTKRQRSTTTDVNDEGPPARHQRPLSIAVRPTLGSSTAQDSISCGSPSFGATDNVFMPTAESPPTVFPQRYYTATIGQYECTSIPPTICKDPQSPEPIELEPYSQSPVAMES